ncbi:MAG: [NiFe]-hydrogenase assembly, chaperone, HybE [Gammaproteobacteria bacterium]|nr:MAG: [NiFe]-hydrogenase assembly, chaperone, HybE [Gammaproteobacteria bacterium]
MPFSESPADAFEACFRKIQTERMGDIPLLNPAIRVEAVGFQEWEGHWLGALVTPWFLSLVIVPRTGSPWPEELKADKKSPLAIAFPGATLPFQLREEEELGPYLACSLASPVREWPSHESLRNTALEALERIKRIPLAEASEDTENVQAPCDASRRQFLSGFYSA